MINMNFVGDDELLTIVKSDTHELFLAPFKHGAKKYKPYTSLLGNMNAHSRLVKLNLPGIAVKLYRRKDANIVKAMDVQCQILVDSLISIAKETLDMDISEDDLAKLDKEALLGFVIKFIEEKHGDPIDYDLFWVQMHLIDAEDLGEKREYVMNSLKTKGLILDDIDNAEEEKEDDKESSSEEPMPVVQPPAIKKAKLKKLTAQEKAAKNKAALAAKAKEKGNESTEALNDETTGDTAENQIEVNVGKPSRDEETNDIVVNKELVKHKEDSEMKSQKEDKMGVYVGIINIKGSFYNFTPIGIYENGDFIQYSEADLDNLLPLSYRHNINLYYSIRDEIQIKFMQNHFTENKIILLRCDINELEENFLPDGNRNPTGYKYPAYDGFNKGKICFPSAAEIYPVISQDDLMDDIRTKSVIKLRRDDFVPGERVLVRFRDNFTAGPFEIKHSDMNDVYFIKMQAVEGKHFVEGYNTSDCTKIQLEPSVDIEEWFDYVERSFYVIKEGAVKTARDFISDEDLLKSFSETIKAERSDYKPVEIGNLIEKVGNSQIVGDCIPESIKESRINRIKEIFGADESLNKLYDESSEIFWELLLRSDKAWISDIMTSVLEEHPEVWERIPAQKVLQAKTDSARAELERIQSEIEEKRNQKAQDEEMEDEKSSKQIETRLSKDIAERSEELKELLEYLEVAKDLKEIKDKTDKLKEEEIYLENHKAHLQNDTKSLESKFVELVNASSGRMADITFDGFMSSKMLQAAAEWESNANKDSLVNLVEAINDLEDEDRDASELLRYIVSTIQHVRPGYGKNDIINIMTCMTQGFLTVFSGAPGCGKTSICNIIGKILGLNSYEKKDSKLKDVKRYVPVSVERGWTSKRDFIGYYNPLTKAFEENNREVFDSMKLLDAEERRQYAKWPFIVLLDEANLSPMEYYWADFMNVCDDLKDNNTINLGNDLVFEIPETLHFLATINNDHTTERLSPRLIDRAWVISLPKVAYNIQNSIITDDMIECISWPALIGLFDTMGVQVRDFDPETKSIYDGIKECASKLNIYVSPRVDQAIFRYWGAASRIMEEDEYASSSIIALDYAVTQKILPKISGSGEKYEKELKEFQKYCDNKNLTHAARMLQTILDKGEGQMKYYQFFG